MRVFDFSASFGVKSGMFITPPQYLNCPSKEDHHVAHCIITHNQPFTDQSYKEQSALTTPSCRYQRGHASDAENPIHGCRYEPAPQMIGPTICPNTSLVILCIPADTRACPLYSTPLHHQLHRQSSTLLDWPLSGKVGHLEPSNADRPRSQLRGKKGPVLRGFSDQP